MVTDIKYLLNGVEANPSNKDEINYVFDFTNRQVRELELDTDKLRFVREDYTAIKTWRATYGDYVGMPLDIQYGNGTTVKYLLDFADPAFKESGRAIECKIVRFKGIDNFFDNATGLSFDNPLLNWQPSDFVEVDYVVVPPNQFAYFISLSLATFSLAQELAKAIQEIQEGIADLVKATVPVGIPPAPDWGAIAVAAIKLAARIAYTIFIIIALIKVGTELLNLIFPKIRQFEAIKLKRLIEKGCQALGYTLQSSLLNGLSEATVLPVPLKEKDPSLWKELFAPQSLAYTKGHPSGRDTIQTLGQAIEAVEEVFNGKTSVVNNVVIIEEEEYYEQNAVNDVPIAFNLQEQMLNENGINSEEIFKRLVALYQVDPSDLNTFDDTAKSLYEISSQVINSPSVNHELIRRYDRVDIPFARGTRKGSLTFVEEAAKVLAKAIDLFTNGNLAQKVEARKDVMQVSEQYFGVTKLLWMNGTKLHSNQNQFIGADVIVNKYHANRFIQNNQKKTFEGMPYASTEEELFNILANNYVNLENGQVAEIRRIAWNAKECLASVDWRTKKPPVNETTTIINAG